MPIVWSEDLSVHIKEIDDQHKTFLSILNNLYEVMVQGGGNLETENILRQLNSYTNFHFATEEKYFDKFGYENAEEHKEEHRKLLAQVGEFNQRFTSEGAKIIPELLSFLEDWLADHLALQDQKYADFFHAHNLI